MEQWPEWTDEITEALSHEPAVVTNSHFSFPVRVLNAHCSRFARKNG